VKIEVKRHSLLIIPETPQDEAWLEEVLGLKKDGDTAPLVRQNAIGLSCWAYAEVQDATWRPKDATPGGEPTNAK
jgi:hypothetical protein